MLPLINVFLVVGLLKIQACFILLKKKLINKAAQVAEYLLHKGHHQADLGIKAVVLTPTHQS